MTESFKFHCPDCNGEREFSVRFEGNLETMEEWEVVYCDTCGWERERKLTPTLFGTIDPTQ